MLKDTLRKRLLRKLRQQPPKERLTKSNAIAWRLARFSLYRRARILMCYVAFDGEVETRPILAKAIADGKKVAVPISVPHAKRLIAAQILNPEMELKRRGSFGIPEPRKTHRINPKRLDLILVPGLAFDRKGYRLGRGGGYFDRFLSSLPARIPRVGLAFRFQVVKKLPVESHDQPVDKVITD